MDASGYSDALIIVVCFAAASSQSFDSFIQLSAVLPILSNRLFNFATIMKLAFVKISTAIFTFLIGVIAFQFWNILPENEFQIESLNVPAIEPIATQTSACELMDETGDFGGQLISFQATAYVVYDGKIILCPNDCYCHTHNITFVKLELDSYSGANNDLKILLEGKNRDSRDDFKEVDVRIIGTAKITYDAKGYRYYSIFPADIKIISSFRKFEPKGAA